MLERAHLRDVAALLLAHRFDVTDENRLCDGIGRVLVAPAWEREAQLEGAGRVDFFHVDRRIAVEVKVKGSPSAVADQLLRYAWHPAVAGVLLVTARAQLARGMPDSLGGKPFDTCELWRSAL